MRPRHADLNHLNTVLNLFEPVSCRVDLLCPQNKTSAPIWSTEPAPYARHPVPCHWRWAWDMSQCGPLIFSSCSLLKSSPFITVCQLPFAMHICLALQTQITIALGSLHTILLFLIPHCLLSLCFVFLGKGRGSRLPLFFAVILGLVCVVPTHESNFVINKATKE